METLNEKASRKLFEIIKEADNLNIDSWEKEKEFIRYLIQQHINQSYMIDIRYYKEYTNFWHEVLITLNEL
jgi:hypothetical protein